MKKGVVYWVYFSSFFLLAGLVSSCSYESTVLDLNSLWKSEWNFSDPSEYNFDHNYVEVKNGSAQLKALDLTLSENDFMQGLHVGTLLKDNHLSLEESTSTFADLRNILPNRVSSMIAYWRFEGDLLDASGNGHNGTFNNGSKLSSGKVGTGVYFDGLDDDISIPDSDDFNLKNFSISFWFYRYDNDYSRFISQQSSDYWIVGIRNSPNNDLYFNSSIDGYSPSVNTGVMPENNAWNHITFSRDTENDVIKLYLNGSLVHQSPTSNNDSYELNQSIRLGSYNGINHFLSGHLDEVAIFNEVVSDSDVLKIFNQQNKLFSDMTGLSPLWTPKWEQLVGYWSMDGHWQDSSGNENHATPSNLPTFSSNPKVGYQSGDFDYDTGHQHLLVANTPLLENVQEGAITIMAWYKPNNLPININNNTVAHGLINKTGQHFGLNYRNNSRFSFELWNNMGSAIGPGSTLNFPPGQFYHVVGVINPTVNTASLYINGEKLNEVDITGETIREYGTAPWIIGAAGTSANTSTYHYAADGQLDEVAIFNTHLSTGEIQKIYHRQKQKYASHYDSPIINIGGATTQWPSLSWSTKIPFGKELVGDFNNDGSPDLEINSNNPQLTESINNGLIGYWPLNELGGANSILDQSGNNHHGSPSGGVSLSLSGQLGPSLNCDGTNSPINIPATGNLSFNPNDNYSFSFWINTDNTHPGGTFSSPFMIDTDLGYLAWIWFRDNTHPSLPSSVAFNQFDGSASSNSAKTLNNSIESGKWYHIFGKNDSGVLRLYINGVATIDTGISLDMSGNTVNAIVINPTNFKGLIDEVAIWNRALSDQEIQNLYRRGANRVKLQVKSCIDSTCQCKSFSSFPAGTANDCDGDTIVNSLDFDDPHKAEFIGPGGDASTYYSELLTAKTQTSFLTVLITLQISMVIFA